MLDGQEMMGVDQEQHFCVKGFVLSMQVVSYQEHEIAWLECGMADEISEPGGLEVRARSADL